MEQKEKKIIFYVLTTISILVLIDLIADLSEGANWGHFAFEGFIALLSLVGVYVVLRDSFHLKKELVFEKNQNVLLKEQEIAWKEKNKKLTLGLSSAIDEQLEKWRLSNSEKEVALLLLKGCSLKEIASIRNTTEKTARVQSMAIYSKAGLASRSELAAFFLEDLLEPIASGKNQSDNI